MKGCIILYIVRIFSSSEIVESHIMPLKGRLAVALKEEAMTGICGRLSALPHFNTVLGIHL